SSETGIAEAAGAYESAAVDITPVLNDGVISFEVIGKQQGVYGSGTFVLTLTTNGDAELEIEAATVSYTLHVVVFGKADILGWGRAKTYYVGDYVERFSIASSPINPVIDYGATVSGSLKDITGTYDSGLSVTHVTDLTGRTVGIELGGTAVRPGVYLVWVFINCWTEGGQYDNLPSSFDRGNNAVPLVVTILDDDFAEGNLMVCSPAEVSVPAACYRAVWLSETVQAIASAEHLYNCELGQISEMLWAGSYVDDRGTYTITYQYQLRNDGDAWLLEGREIDSRSEDPPPPFEVYESSDLRLEGQTVPHIYGWTNVILQGLTAFALWARPTSEDPWTLYGFFNLLAPSVYEQQIQYTPQYEGYVTAPERQFASGLIYSEDPEIEGDFTGYLVKKEPITTMVTPYAPPATEFYNTMAIRDVATIISADMIRDDKKVVALIPHSLYGQRDGISVPGGEAWRYWAGARRIVPLNGTSGDWASLPPVTVTYESENRTTSRSRADYNNQALSGDHEVQKADLVDRETITYNGSIAGGGQQRDLQSILLAIGATNTGHGKYDSSSSIWTVTEFTNQLGTTTDDREIVETEIGEGDNAFGAFAVYVASGPMTGLCKHQAVAVEMGTFSGSGETVKNRHEDLNGVINDYPSAGTFGITAAFNSERPVVVSGATLGVSYDYEHVEQSVSGTVSYGYESGDGTYSETGGGIFGATHSRTTVNGETVGTTTVIYTPTGEPEQVTTSDDPDGSVYAQALENFSGGIEIPPPAWEGPPGDLMTSTLVSWTEQYYKRKFSFKSGV
ncbi:MAG: hypothetical protein AB7F32_00745, partial [Victivallaceae bacterium]